MATIKSFTSLEQSKKLAEILPLESADMHYNNVSIKGINYVDEHRAELMEYNRAIKVLSKYTINPLFEVIPCWSLAALLEELNRNCWKVSLKCCGAEWNMTYDDGERYISVSSDYAIDACNKMIIKLHELKML